ncbi:MAG: ABC transporter substrate-binding protein [Candidatus Desantisbacteria bacterium]
MKLHLWLTCMLISLCCLTTNVCASEPRIAIVISRQIQPYMAVVREIKAGVNAVFYEYNLNGDKRNIQKIIAEILSKNPDIIVAIGTEAADGCCGKTEGIPTIFSMVLNPYILKLNMSGVALDISAKAQILTLRKILPKAKKIGVIYNPAVSASLIAQAQKENISIVASPVKSESQIAPALKNMLDQGRIDAFWLIPDPMVANQSIARYILETTLKANVPVFAPSPAFVKNGALFSVSACYDRIGKQTVKLIGQILTNGNTRIFIEEPEDPILTINLKTAELLNIVIPDQVKNLADETIE